MTYKVFQHRTDIHPHANTVCTTCIHAVYALAKSHAHHAISIIMQSTCTSGKGYYMYFGTCSLEKSDLT